MKRKKRRLKTWVKVSLIIIFVFIISVIILNINDNKKNTGNVNPNEKITTKKEKKEPPNELSIVMVGDCLIHKMVYTDALTGDGNYSFSKMFTEVSPLIINHDLAYYNQESIIGGKELGLSAYPRFNSPEEIGDDMVKLGFNLVSLANNHTMDKGEKGVINSVNYWKTKPGVYYTGQALSEKERQDNIKVKEINGITYAFLSYTTQTNGLLPPSGKDYLTNIYSDEKAKKDIEKVRSEADLIIVAMHWGEEYQKYENQNQQRIAKYLSDLGVNLIIGAHPHVIQPVEYVGDTLVFYSLGNFISAQDTPDKLTGAIANLTVKKDKDKISFKDVKINLIYTSFKYSKPYNFKLYPYSKLNDNILNNYKTYYEKYKNILERYNVDMEVDPLNVGN